MHTLQNLIVGERYYYRITSTDAAANARTVTGDFVTDSDAGPGARFKIVAWNLQYGKGMTTKAARMTCPLPGLKDNAQCQIADNPATPLIDERAEERRQSAWGVGLTQRYLNSPAVLGDPELIALLLTEANSGPASVSRICSTL